MELISDENVKAKLVEFINEQGIKTSYAQKGLNNSVLFSLACKKQKVILTHDKDFLNTDLFPPQLTAGILLLNIHPPKLSVLQSRIAKVLDKFSEQDIKGKLLIISEHAVEIIEGSGKNVKVLKF